MTPLAGLGTIQVADSVVEFSESGERVKLVGVDGANEEKWQMVTIIMKIKRASYPPTWYYIK